MKHTILALGLALCLPMASAKGTSVATMAATRGHVASTSQAAAASSSRPIAPVCLWQVPRLLHWINVSAIAHMYIQQDSYGSRSGHWALRLRIMGTDPRGDTMPLYAASQDDVMKMQSLLMARIAECAEGTR